MARVPQGDRSGRGAPELDPLPLLARCESMVARALRAGADGAEAYWTAGASLDVELEKDRVAYASRAQESGGAIRVVVGGRLGFAYLTDPEDAVGAIERALRNARLAPAKGFAFLAGGRPPAMPGRWDDEAAALDVEAVVQRANAVVAGAKQACPAAVVVGGGVAVGWSMEAVANSAGVGVAGRGTDVRASASLVLEADGGAVSHHDQDLAHTLGLDAHALGMRTAEVAASLANPEPLANGGRLDVVLQPEAASDLVVDLAMSACDGDDAMRGKTVWSQQLGHEVAAPRLSITDDPLHAHAIGCSPFDGEGLPARRTSIIEAGRLRSYLFDARTAHEHRVAPTNTATRPGFKAPPDAGAQHVVVEAAGAQSLTRLAAGVDEGILVGNVLGAHTANATTGEFSVTAPNVWRIRKGAVEGAVREVALAGSLGDLLRRLDGASDAPKAMAGARVPALRFRGLDVAV